ncbi:MAG: transcriptional repressor [Nitriliruptorales bacterium]|nr:transcriptional repressor [Nitriliruptorales bacterium]
MHDEIHATVRDLLRGTRQRYTRGRQELVELLAGQGRPVTIPELLAAGASQAQSSLYRNLAVLEQCGAVRRISSVDDVARYELDEGLTEHHHHFVCSSCGRIDDVTLSESVEASLAKAASRAGDDHGYEVGTHRLELVGTCPDCT